MNWWLRQCPIKERKSCATNNGCMSPVSSTSSWCITSIHPGGSVWSHNVLTPWRPNLTTEMHLQLSLSESTDTATYWCCCLIFLSLFLMWVFFSAEGDAIEIIKHGMPKTSKDPNRTSSGSIQSSGKCWNIWTFIEFFDWKKKYWSFTGSSYRFVLTFCFSLNWISFILHEFKNLTLLKCFFNVYHHPLNPNLNTF